VRPVEARSVNLSMSSLPLYALMCWRASDLAGCGGFAITFGYWTMADPGRRTYVIPARPTAPHHPRRRFPAVLAVGLAGLLRTANLGLELATLLAFPLENVADRQRLSVHALKAVPLVCSKWRPSSTSATRAASDRSSALSTTGLVWNTMFGKGGPGSCSSPETSSAHDGHYLPGWVLPRERRSGTLRRGGWALRRWYSSS